MNRPILFILLLSYSWAAVAQQKNDCVFDRLFTLSAGISKAAVQDSLKTMFALTPVNTTNQKTSTEFSAKKTAANETLVYKAVPASCFNGTNTFIAFAFSNDKLYKANISTQYAHVDYYDMADNFNLLRNIFKASWHDEKQTKSSLNKLVSAGYTYSNRHSKQKIELQYITSKENNGIYIIQLSWINLHNEGLETLVN